MAERDGDVKLVRKGQVHDHVAEDGAAGLVSVVGVKYTTAREVAERAVDIVVSKLKIELAPCKTDQTPIFGADFESLDAVMALAKEQQAQGLTPEAVESVVFNYGNKFNALFETADEDDDLSAEDRLLAAQVRYAVRNEMALKLTDVILRRTELGSAGYPGDPAVQFCAEIMADECGWDWSRTQAEIAEVKAIYQVKAMA